MKFLITYKDGKTEEVYTDAETVEDQCNRTFGLTPEECDDFGVKIEMIGENPEYGHEMPEEPVAIQTTEVQEGSKDLLTSDGTVVPNPFAPT